MHEFRMTLKQKNSVTCWHRYQAALFLFKYMDKNQGSSETEETIPSLLCILVIKEKQNYSSRRTDFFVIPMLSTSPMGKWHLSDSKVPVRITSVREGERALHFKHPN